MRWIALVGIWAALLSALCVQPAAAVDVTKSTAEFGPEGVWTSACNIDRMTDSKTCRMMSYRLFEEGQNVGFVALSIIPTGTDYHLFLTTSKGLIESCAIRVDRQPRIETQIATINMCMFPNFMSGRVLDQFRNGSTVLVRVNFLRGGKQDIDFSLNGFSRSFEEMQRMLQ
jgi:invasion protein IalB